MASVIRALRSALVGLCLVLGLVEAASAQVRVRGYIRKDGTYVHPHTRSAPDGNPTNNYGYPGNYNPNSGEISKGDPLTYLERYYARTRTGTPAPAISPPTTASPRSRQAWTPPDLAGAPAFGEDLPSAEVDRSKSYCTWLYSSDALGAERCASTQVRSLASLLVPDYSAAPPDELSRGGRYCEWLYGDNRAGFYHCLNNQIVGLTKAPATLANVPTGEAARARKYCEWLYGDNRAGNQSCLAAQERGLAAAMPDGNGLPDVEWRRSKKYCEWLYADNRAGAAACLVSQDRSIRSIQAAGRLSTPHSTESSRYCEWLYGDNRGGYWNCLRTRP